MVVDEDPFSPIASSNTLAFDLRELIDSKKARGIPPRPKIRKVWTHNQNLIYKDDLIEERRMFLVIEKKKNGRRLNNSSEKDSIGLGHKSKDKRFSKENNVSQKERHTFPRKKGMNDP